MYVLQEVLFSFEVFIKNTDEDDQIFLALASIDVESIKKMFTAYRSKAADNKNKVAAPQ